MTGIAAEFRHTIGDCLYGLYTPYESNDDPDQVLMYPVVKKTERYVYVHGPWFYDKDKTYRFSREDLEAKGRAWNLCARLYGQRAAKNRAARAVAALGQDGPE